jgi:ankyrin repeat protein
MNTYCVRLASVMLFFVTFVSSLVIGMEKEVSFLPRDIQVVIADKTLRVILDEAEDNPELLMAPQWRAPKKIMEMTVPFSIKQETGSVNDMVILLIENGANPNTKNYKGKTIAHILSGWPMVKNHTVIESLLQLLKSFGLDMTIKTSGATPDQLRQKSMEIVEMLNTV